jgi:hypothetical protein
MLAISLISVGTPGLVRLKDLRDESVCYCEIHYRYL